MTPPQRRQNEGAAAGEQHAARIRTHPALLFLDGFPNRASAQFVNHRHRGQTHKDDERQWIMVTGDMTQCIFLWNYTNEYISSKYIMERSRPHALLPMVVYTINTQTRTSLQSLEILVSGGQLVLCTWAQERADIISYRNVILHIRT